MSAQKISRSDMSVDRSSNHTAGIEQGEQKGIFLSEVAAVDITDDISTIPIEDSVKLYPDPAEYEAALRANIEEALRAPIVRGALYAQLISGRGEGMYLIQRLLTQSCTRRYMRLPITDSDSIAVVGEGVYFDPLYSTEPLLCCQCFPLANAPSNTLQPLNELVLRLRKHGAQ